MDLGLNIVKQLVELHGGDIRVKSPGVGQGATFAVSLPVTVIHPKPAAEPERRHPVARSPNGIPAHACISLKGLKVLGGGR